MQPGPIRPKLLDLFHAPTSQEREREDFWASQNMACANWTTLSVLLVCQSEQGRVFSSSGTETKEEEKGDGEIAFPPDSCPFTSDHGGLLPRRQDSPKSCKVRPARLHEARL
ncbi:hypothetical protein MCOR27_005226 [Pyricularia oryzae]|uniref:Uncharacterized protein n=1 Tax=Pyricularia grisea TaxID=148305 RepID=A0ABQ8N3W6_PYRGI|nr:hypothetical protein MCOR01_000275 [Pyricularia oryzae]KAI6290538.1 hypothetical protein MCOR33_011241 [Pyricularia grisea]KAI6253381.1 hypothetical protein MCOR19_010066 [Pyricularia oryzae]KAI6279222.1 hypothetical protein MCOR27_005226 [Pyricularia oryzae]KAI6287659.1 hypothetical protein MCOR26_000559 [Pyricularia oryzae]